MDENVTLNVQVFKFVMKNLLFVSLIVIGVILVGVGLFQYFASKGGENSLEIVSNAQDSSLTNSVKGVSVSNKKISVDVEGSVQKPGVYSFSDTSRVQDALIAAGGLSSNADRDYISKHLNQAQKITDGGKIYIPAKGETTQSLVTSNSNDTTIGVSNQVIADNSGLININSATAEQLDTLPKIGVVTAQKIISARPYSAIEELVSKKVLTQKTYDGLKDKVTAE